MSNANSETIARLTDEAWAALSGLTNRDAILVVFNRTKAAWSLVIGPPASTSDDLTDYDEAVQLHVAATMSRSAVQAQVEKSTKDVAHLVATNQP